MGALVTVGVNTLAFYLISKLVPGFKIKDEKTALIMALAFSFLMFVGTLLVAPFLIIVTILLSIISVVPIIGPLLAGSGILVTTFLVSFALTAVMLIAIDKMLEDFEMSSKHVALVASFLLAVLNVVIRGFLGV
ncbi:MAG TPA: phage holin family protein [Candidatus Ozemobacteraceae bacterium]|nr:phage holin family protein [Candidatus Ozemobacteraceae bacterium]